jgi:hypothetical protein
MPNLILVRKNPNKERASRLAATQQGSDAANIRFTNESPFLLISNVSVQDLLARIPTQLHYPFFFFPTWCCFCFLYFDVKYAYR